MNSFLSVEEKGVDFDLGIVLWPKSEVASA
jgi:hypothetical protein